MRVAAPCVRVVTLSSLWHCPGVRGGGRLRARHRARRTGAITVVLFAGTASAALGLALQYRLDVAQNLVTILVGGGAPAALYLAWATYRLSSAQGALQAGSSRLSQLADELATAVGAQWQAEAQARRLTIPIRCRCAGNRRMRRWSQAGLRSLQSPPAGWAGHPPATRRMGS